MTRMFYPPELDHSRERDSFDPIREGERYGLLPELSLAIWKRVSEATTDAFGRRNEDQTLEQFHELAARITARGRRLQPNPGRLTHVGTELNGEWPGTRAADELMPRVPGRQTLAAAEVRRWASWVGDGAVTAAGGSSGSVPRKVDAEMARREPSGASDVARVMASLRAWGPGGSDVHPAAVGRRSPGTSRFRHPIPQAQWSLPKWRMRRNKEGSTPREAVIAPSSTTPRAGNIWRPAWRACWRRNVQADLPT